MSANVTINSVKLHEFTRGDDKDRGDSVTLTFKKGNQILLRYGPVGGDIVYRNNDDAYWEGGNPVPMTIPFTLSESSQVTFNVSKTGDKGWDAQFEVIGMGSDGNSYTVLPRTATVKFNGDNPDHTFTLASF